MTPCSTDRPRSLWSITLSHVSPQRLTWVDHPAREHPGRLLLATVVIVAMALSVLWADGDVFLAVLSAVILLVSIRRFLVPTRYTLTETEVIVQTPGWTRRRRWTDLRRWDEWDEGFFLSPFRRRNRFLERTRGVVLRGGDRDVIREVIAFHIKG